MSDTTYVKSIDGGTAAPVPAPVLSTRYNKDDAELDFASDDGDEQLKDTLVFEQGEATRPEAQRLVVYFGDAPVNQELLDLAAADSSEADVATVTITVAAVNNYLPAVQYDYDLS